MNSAAKADGSELDDGSEWSCDYDMDTDSNCSRMVQVLYNLCLDVAQKRLSLAGHVTGSSSYYYARRR